MTKSTYLTLLALLIPLLTYAQLPQYRNFHRNSYMAGTQNWDIAQMSDHRMLFANNDGLLVYDGDHWTTFPISNGSKVRSVMNDSTAGRIYAGSFCDLGYFSQSKSSSGISYTSLYSLVPDRFNKFEEIWQILKLDDNIIFRSFRQLLVYNPQQNSIKAIPSSSDIQAMAIFHNRVYAADGSELKFLEGGRFYSAPNTGSLAGMKVLDLVPFPNGDAMIVVTADSGLFIYDGKSLSQYRPELTAFLSENITKCAAINDRYLVIGTMRKGIVVVELNSGILHFVDSSDGLLDNTVLCAHFDFQDNLWLGLANGITYVMDNMPFHKFFPKSKDMCTAYASVCDGDRILLGSNQGLFSLAYPSFSSSETFNKIHSHVWSLHKVGATVLCGTNVTAYAIRGNSVWEIKGLGRTWDFRAVPGQKDRVIANADNGFFLLDVSDPADIHITPIRGISHASGNFEIDRDHSIWLTDRTTGVVHARLSDDFSHVISTQVFGISSLLPNPKNAVISMAYGNIYISSADKLYRYDRNSKALIRTEIPANANQESGNLRLIEAGNNLIWAVSRNAMSLLSVSSDSRFRLISPHHRNLGSIFQTDFGRFCLLDNGHSIFNGDEGFFLIDNKKEFKKSQSPLIMSYIYSGDDMIYAEGFGTNSKTPEFEHNTNSLSFSFVLPEYRARNAVEYQCRLEGYDKGWVSLGHSGKKEYTGLDKGHYTLRIRAVNLLEGSTVDRNFRFTVLPAWYQSWWAICIYAILAAVLLLLSLKLIRNIYDAKVRRLQKEKEQELHRQQMAFERENEKKEKELVSLRNRQLEMDLKHKASELADSTINLVRKNDMLTAISEDIQLLAETIRNTDASSPLIKKTDEIRRNIKMNLSEDANWDKFQEYFNLVYDNYIDVLKSRFPDLKLPDIKLCVYLKMGLSSKEISSLLNTAVRSVENSRYRLRKKLGLSTETNLSEFLQNLQKEDPVIVDPDQGSAS